jgi:hypothetical protein
MKPTIVFDTAQVTRQESGPDIVEIVGTDAKGSTRKFDAFVPRGGGDAYLFDLGFTEFTLYRPTRFRLRSGKPVTRMHRHYATFDTTGNTVEGGPHPIGARPVIEEPELNEGGAS